MDLKMIYAHDDANREYNLVLPVSMAGVGGWKSGIRKKSGQRWIWTIWKLVFKEAVSGYYEGDYEIYIGVC